MCFGLVVIYKIDFLFCVSASTIKAFHNFCSLHNAVCLMCVCLQHVLQVSDYSQLRKIVLYILQYKRQNFACEMTFVLFYSLHGRYLQYQQSGA